MRFIIDGKITGKGRPRFARNGRAYTPAETERYECLVRNEYRNAGGTYSEKPIVATIDVRYPLIKSDYDSKGKPNRKGRAKLEGAEMPTKKPDCDNIAKIILDALNGVAYKDDSQVVALKVIKRYSERESVSVSLEEAE